MQRPIVLFYVFLLMLVLPLHSAAWTTASRRATTARHQQPVSRLYAQDNDWNDNEGKDDKPLQSVPKEPERDLFIPIFALVSLAGLFGAYGYEMMRLASRGELYLPWN